MSPRSTGPTQLGLKAERTAPAPASLYRACRCAVVDRSTTCCYQHALVEQSHAEASERTPSMSSASLEPEPLFEARRTWQEQTISQKAVLEVEEEVVVQAHHALLETSQLLPATSAGAGLSAD